MEKFFLKCPECDKIELREIFDLRTCSNCGYYGLNFKILKALSTKQPWAWLIMNGHKTIENRDNLKNFRGDFLIHASMAWDPKYINILSKVHTETKRAFKMMPTLKSTYDFGGIIGVATIIDSVQQSDSPWFVGKNGFIIDKPEQLPFTKCKGALSFFIPKIV